MKLQENMKLSDKTLKILQNFTTINQSLAFKEGKKLRTISVMKNVLAEAEIEEYIPKDFAIYDLPQFLNTVSLCSSPDIDVSSNSSFAHIKEEQQTDPNISFQTQVLLLHHLIKKWHCLVKMCSSCLVKSN